jgi:hypothetical protein
MALKKRRVSLPFIRDYSLIPQEEKVLTSIKTPSARKDDDTDAGRNGSELPE